LLSLIPASFLESHAQHVALAVLLLNLAISEFVFMDRNKLLMRFSVPRSSGHLHHQNNLSTAGSAGVRVG
jgi:hypothetical protein